MSVRIDSPAAVKTTWDPEQNNGRRVTRYSSKIRTAIRAYQMKFEVPQVGDNGIRSLEVREVN
jgi:hypothetical protein